MAMIDVEAAIAQVRARMRTTMPELMARIDWPKARVEAHRRDRLREVLAHAIGRSAWHRERLSGIDPASFRPEDLRSLPVMTKADLVGSFDRISTEPQVTRDRCEAHLEGADLLLDGEFTVTVSGGTSGVRAISAGRVERMAETFVAGLVRFVARWGRRTGSIGTPEPPFMVASAPGNHASSVLKRILGGGPDRAVSVVEPVADIVAALNAADPAHLIVYSSFIPQLAAEARAGRLRIRPRILTPVAESFLPEHEAAVSEVWDCVIMSSWGATETGLLGAGSGFDTGMLLLDDMVIVEPVDARGRRVEPGVGADKLLVTPLVPRVLPLIRYELTDQLTVLDDPASCGSSFTRVSYVRGRQDEEFLYHGDVAVHPHTFRTVLSRQRAITEYQVEQTDRGAVLRVVLAPDVSGVDIGTVGSELEGRLAHLGVPAPAVDVVVVQNIPRTKGSAKLRRFVPLTRTADVTTGVGPRAGSKAGV
jgi:phenylacetate-coenzyme A ligase PaaK-like adenylate-forming protein